MVTLKRIEDEPVELATRAYYIGPHRVHASSCETDLGVDIDTKLSFEEHINNRVKSASCIMGAIRRSFKYLDCSTFKLLFRGMVRSKLEYAAPVWSPSTARLCDKIESVQRTATAMLPGMKGLTYPQRLAKLKLTTLKARRLRGDMLTVYKILHEQYDPRVSPALPLRSEHVGGRQLRGDRLTLQSQPYRLNIRKNSFTHRVVSVWNALPTDVKEACSVNAFKNRIDNFWQGRDFLTDPEMSFP